MSDRLPFRYKSAPNKKNYQKILLLKNHTPSFVILSLVLYQNAAIVFTVDLTKTNNMAETKECTACHELKSIRQFNCEKTECNACETFRCSHCTANKTWKNFSHNQMQKGEARKCRSCTGQGSSTLECTECGKILSLTLFKKESRSPLCM
jgi:hypothetical protein